MIFRSLAELRGLSRWAPIVAGVHLALVTAVGHVRVEHVVVDLLVVALAVAGRRSRAFLTAAMPLWMTGVLYADLQPLLLPLRGEIFTGALWALDATLFPAPGGRPWPAFFAEHNHPFWDLVCGAAYLLYLFQFFGVVIYLYIREARLGRAMAWCFLGVNLIGIAIYVLLPAAPPWYVLAHGPGPADLTVAPSAAGAARFDELLGIRYFSNFYARNPNVFGAMPSLHVAYPTVAAFFLWRQGPLLRAFGLLFAALVAFSAIYLVHHYVLDVVAGAAVGLVTCTIVELATAPGRPAAHREMA